MMKKVEKKEGTNEKYCQVPVSTQIHVPNTQ